MIDTNIIGNILKTNSISRDTSASSQIVVTDAVLLENGLPLLHEDGRYVQLESETKKVKTNE